MFSWLDRQTGMQNAMCALFPIVYTVLESSQGQTFRKLFHPTLSYTVGTTATPNVPGLIEL